MSAVEAALKAAGFPSLSWYDALLELEKAGDGIRPNELEPRLLLPQYGLSRLLARMERDGLVARRPAEADGRGQIVTITAAGLRLRSRMWPVYAAAIEKSLGARLSQAEARQLAYILKKIGSRAAGVRRPQGGVV